MPCSRDGIHAQSLLSILVQIIQLVHGDTRKYNINAIGHKKRSRAKSTAFFGEQILVTSLGLLAPPLAPREMTPKP